MLPTIDKLTPKGIRAMLGSCTTPTLSRPVPKRCMISPAATTDVRGFRCIMPSGVFPIRWRMSYWNPGIIYAKFSSLVATEGVETSPILGSTSKQWQHSSFMEDCARLDNSRCFW
ncbi:hypothetical protein AMTRI_Chr12g269180 [Amborella trichopoda]